MLKKVKTKGVHFAQEKVFNLVRRGVFTLSGFSNYHSIVVKLLGEENAGENWATLLEYGSQNRIVIAIQNIGISRHTAIKVYNKCKNYGLLIKDNKLMGIEKRVVLKRFRKNSMEYDELIKIL